MLLEFKTINYKSFRDELIFSMVPAPKQQGLNYSILKETIGKKKYKALSSAVVYGANASGKTNIIGAMDTFKNIVLRGNIRNSNAKAGPNAAAHILELIPYRFHTEPQPVTFAIKFITDGLLIDYALSMDLGAFFESEHSRRVLAESLSINEEMVFNRADTLNFGSMDAIAPYLVHSFAENKASMEAIAQQNTDAEDLFLTNGFKTMFSARLVALITEWLEDKFDVVYFADASIVRQLPRTPDKTVYVDKTLNDAARLLGASANNMGYVYRDNNDDDPILCSVLKNPGEQAARLVSAEMFESFGTFRFANLFPLIAGALQTGRILVIDEFDASLHPMVLMSIINVFHNDDINIHRAQLIFNTHNPIFLNANLFRRDEIKFVERDDETLVSTHYSLADFRTTGKNGVRNGEDYLKNYFLDRYGAIREIDFTPIFERVVANKEGV